MSLNSSNLSVLAYANNFTLWHYVTGDQDVGAVGYFNMAADMLRKHDLLIVNAAGVTDFYTVVDNTGSIVTVQRKS